APPAAPADRERPAELANQLAALRAELEQVKGKLPDQSHAMKDVGYHFANLWFAGQEQNWPLARFYLDESRSHLPCAVRSIPTRKTQAGEVDRRGILDGVDNSLLSEVQKAIQAEDLARFTNAYRNTLVGCYSCHKASEKPYLRPQIPARPEASI